MRHLVVSGACALGLVAGCGGSSDESKVKETAEAYYAAYAESDGQKACSLLTAKGQKASGFATGGCEDAIAGPVGGLAKGGDIADQLNDASIENVKVTGTKATADARFPGGVPDELPSRSRATNGRSVTRAARELPAPAACA